MARSIDGLLISRPLHQGFGACFKVFGDALNAWLENLVRERGLIWADYHSVLKAADDSMRPEFTRDGLHPGIDGYAVMRPVARSALAIALG